MCVFLGINFHTYLARGIPWSRRRCLQDEAYALHSAWADSCDYPKSGWLERIIFGSGDKRSRCPFLKKLKSEKCIKNAQFASCPVFSERCKIHIWNSLLAMVGFTGVCWKSQNLFIVQYSIKNKLTIIVHKCSITNKLMCRIILTFWLPGPSLERTRGTAAGNCANVFF